VFVAVRVRMPSWPGSRRRRNYEAYPTVRICLTITPDAGATCGPKWGLRMTLGMWALFSELWRDRSAATAIEYALIAILVSVAAIAGMGADGHLAQQHLHRLRQQSLKQLANGEGFADGRIFPGSRPTACVSMGPHRRGQGARAS
jgi:Flp pilus assembly pilin Flp